MNIYQKINQKLTEWFGPIGRTIIVIASSIGVIYFIFWLGWKGIIGMIIGMGFMAYLVLSKNTILLFFVKHMYSDHYIWEMFNENKQENKQDDYITLDSMDNGRRMEE